MLFRERNLRPLFQVYNTMKYAKQGKYQAQGIVQTSQHHRRQGG